ncbi:hydroxyacylglutathione hydrolase [Sphingomonas sp.]|jgi:hydroxyacylglutathione hydrolase|uniref:hydroxyacylglutathione hydrolase n=1 Tax=Sphingomonas sp. TaxID=28214 RepID=UPI002ED9FBB0
MLEVVRVPVLADNYAWLVHDPESGATIVVDPGEAGPVKAAAAARGWRIDAVWTTHWHTDHTGGNEALKAAGVEIVAPSAEAARIPTLDRGVGEGDVLMLGRHAATVMTVPGHTQGHVAFHFVEQQIVFTGDTLFAMGCGRLFEGTPAAMFANMLRYAAMPDATQVYCGHEYTLSNARFAAVAEPDNAAIKQRLAEVEAQRAESQPTVPTTIAAERATNPFLRAASVEAFAALRTAKDTFKA